VASDNCARYCTLLLWLPPHRPSRIDYEASSSKKPSHEFRPKPGDKDADNPGEARGKQQDLRCLCALLLKIMHLSFQTASDINGILTGAN